MLIEVSVKVAVVVTVAWLATSLMRRASADVRHLVWLAALLSLPLLAIPLPVLIETPSVRFSLTQSALQSSGASTAGTARYLPWILWLVGVFVAGLRIARSLKRLAAITQRSTASETPGVHLSSEISTPCTWGIVNPVILLPLYASEWSDEHREWAIRHERAHIERRDWFWQLIARAITALFWFHPLVWFAASRLRKEAEHAADDRVLGDGAEAAGYATQLLDVARRVRAGVEGVAMVRASKIEYRIRAIVSASARRNAAGVRAKLIVAAAALALGLSVAASSTPTIHSVREQGIRPPLVIYKVEPGYTEEARDTKVNGTVVLNLVIDEHGLARDVVVRRPLGAGLDQKAVEAIRAWRFKPAEKNGKSVRVSATIEVNFRLL